MISVVIPAHNEEKTLPECLDSLVSQNTKRPFEVIVVDNISTDDTFGVAQRYKDKLDIKVLIQKEKGRGNARRLGFEKARGDIIFSTDADSIVSPDWIETYATLLETKDIVAVTGTCKINDCSGFTNFAFNALQPFFMISYNAIMRHYWLTGCNFAIKKEAYVRSGGFKDMQGQEDVELSFRVKKIGKIMYYKKLPTLTSGRRFKKGIVPGLYPYVHSFTWQFIFRKKAYLYDAR